MKYMIILTFIGGVVVFAAAISGLLIALAYIANRMGLTDEINSGYDDE